METENLITEIEKIIGEINLEISITINDDDFMDEFPVEVECVSNGRSMAVLFLGFRIWSSEDDERLFILNSKEESRESIKIYLVKEVNKIIKHISSIGKIKTS